MKGENDVHVGSPCKVSDIRHYADGTASVLRKAVVYTELRFYQRSDVLRKARYLRNLRNLREKTYISQAIKKTP